MTTREFNALPHYCYPYTQSSIKFANMTQECLLGKEIELVGQSPLALSDDVDEDARFELPVRGTPDRSIHPAFAVLQRASATKGQGHTTEALVSASVLRVVAPFNTDRR